MGEQMSGPGGSIRVVICEDHRSLADALTAVLETEPDFDLIAPPVATGEAAVALCSGCEADVVVMDINLARGIDGIEATRQIKEQCPDIQVLVLSGQEPESFLVAAVEAGASGLVTKGESVERILEEMRAVARGEMLIEPATLAGLMRAAAQDRESRREGESLLHQLTPRESEILELMAKGHGNSHIAEALTISPHTVQTHVSNILSKLDAHSRLEAIALAAKYGLVSLED